MFHFRVPIFTSCYILYICFMPKLQKIVAIFLLPIFVSSTAFINLSLISETVQSKIEISVNECFSEGQSSEQNEESKEGYNDINITNQVNLKCTFEKGPNYNYISTSRLSNFFEPYLPPPEKLVS